jgi:hypothetical protein
VKGKQSGINSILSGYNLSLSLRKRMKGNILNKNDKS